MLASFQRELDWFVTWYNQDRPHMTLLGKTPDEVYFHRRPASRAPRFEPRVAWPRRSACAAPQTLIKGQPGVRLQIRHEWHHGQHTGAALFQGQDKTLANGNASGLTHRPSAMTYAVSAAPRSKVGGGELRATVRHEIFGLGPQLGDELAEELPDLPGSRLLLKDG
jgi:hypothetical protein